MPDDKRTPVVVISTFTMISHSGKRSAEGEAFMRAVKEREWGLLLLDEVHVVPAAMFRKVRVADAVVVVGGRCEQWMVGAGGRPFWPSATL